MACLIRMKRVIEGWEPGILKYQCQNYRTLGKAYNRKKYMFYHRNNSCAGFQTAPSKGHMVVESCPWNADRKINLIPDETEKKRTQIYTYKICTSDFWQRKKSSSWGKTPFHVMILYIEQFGAGEKSKSLPQS